MVGNEANILNYTMTYKDKVFTKELYDNESEEFQKIALEAQRVGTRFGQNTSIEIMVPDMKILKIW